MTTTTTTTTLPTPDGALLLTVLHKIADLEARPEVVSDDGETVTLRVWRQDEWHDDDVFDWIEQHPDPHELVGVPAGRGFCGSSFCFAGWTVELDPAVTWEPISEDGQVSDLVRVGTHTVRHVSEYARERLGLTADQAGRLFAHDNTFADLVAVVTDILCGVDVAAELEAGK